jgi:hypothetical protein
MREMETAMKLCGILGTLLLLAAIANAQITRIATFENYPAGKAFQPSFTDLLSGITFSNSTIQPAPGGFVIDGDPADLFNGNNYLTAGVGPNDGFGFFGFTGTLPQPAIRVSADVLCFGLPSGMVLTGFDSAGTIVAQESGSSTSPDPFSIEIDSGQYNITSFKFTAAVRATAYDNISYSYLPEPSILAGVLAALAFRRPLR